MTQLFDFHPLALKLCDQGAKVPFGYLSSVFSPWCLLVEPTHNQQSWGRILFLRVLAHCRPRTEIWTCCFQALHRIPEMRRCCSSPLSSLHESPSSSSSDWHSWLTAVQLWRSLALVRDHEQRDLDVFSSDADFLFSSPEFQNKCQVPEFSHFKMTVSHEWQFSVFWNVRPLWFSLFAHTDFSDTIVRNMGIIGNLEKAKKAPVRCWKCTKHLQMTLLISADCFHSLASAPQWNGV